MTRLNRPELLARAILNRPRGARARGRGDAVDHGLRPRGGGVGETAEGRQQTHALGEVEVGLVVFELDGRFERAGVIGGRRDERRDARTARENVVPPRVDERMHRRRIRRSVPADPQIGVRDP